MGPVCDLGGQGGSRAEAGRGGGVTGPRTILLSTPSAGSLRKGGGEAPGAASLIPHPRVVCHKAELLASPVGAPPGSRCVGDAVRRHSRQSPEPVPARSHVALRAARACWLWLSAPSCLGACASPPRVPPTGPGQPRPPVPRPLRAAQDVRGAAVMVEVQARRAGAPFRRGAPPRHPVSGPAATEPPGLPPRGRSHSSGLTLPRTACGHLNSHLK